MFKHILWIAHECVPLFLTFKTKIFFIAIISDSLLFILTLL